MLDLNPAVERVGRAVLDSAFSVHAELGPGLLETIYEDCLAWELRERGLSLRRQAALPVRYKGRLLDAGLRLDLIVEDAVVVEVKAVDRIAGVHEAQLLTYLKLTGLQLGFLLNFNVRLLKDGVRRLVHTR
ncbi:MAG TPA: GxxExxY protein [Caulobacteraceae bacterium]|jgi:GxxExxY protein|nr:GxxExxY protein [Caulobacteraceae bacterium]